ncbi:Uncharacterized protein Adt_26736 [Abeliophyllum distichum]|uniref:Copia protein n=1 Tax=Abeliophyllum distichum TaxID=126358 RepID=A0ABD1RTN5_9LAMI
MLTACQSIWLKRILEDIGELQKEATEIYCDSKSAIAMAKNLHSKTKHIGIKHHFIREAEANKEIELKHCRTEEQLADIFTKAFSITKRKIRASKRYDRSHPNMHQGGVLKIVAFFLESFRM